MGDYGEDGEGGGERSGESALAATIDEEIVLPSLREAGMAVPHAGLTGVLTAPSELPPDEGGQRDPRRPLARRQLLPRGRPHPGSLPAAARPFKNNDPATATSTLPPLHPSQPPSEPPKEPRIKDPAPSREQCPAKSAAGNRSAATNRGNSPGDE